MVDADEWDWIVEHARGSFDHLIVATTLPAFAPPGIHHLEAWNEAICDGCWGRVAARLGERLRRAVDLEHWAAFQRSFEQLVDLLRDDQPRVRRRAARDNHDSQRRCSFDLPVGDRPRREWRIEPCLPDCLLAVSKPAQAVPTPHRAERPVRVDRPPSSPAWHEPAEYRLRRSPGGTSPHARTRTRSANLQLDGPQASVTIYQARASSLQEHR